MKKIALLISFAFIGIQAFAQEVYQSKAMNVRFFSSTPMEDIEAKTANATSIITTAKNDILFMMQVKSFTFKSSLMQEHFNETYMESDKFPKTSFKGKVLDYNGKTGSYDIEGDLTIHGVTNKVKTKITISNSGGKLALAANFVVKLIDYKLDVPAMAKKTLAETANISIKLILENKK